MAILQHEERGGQEGDAFYNGVWVCNRWADSQLIVSGINGLVQPPQKIRYPRLSEAPVSPWLIGGQGQIAGAWRWDGRAWQNEGACSGTSPVLFDLWNQIHVIRPAPDATSQGFRALGTDGHPIYGDPTLSINLGGRLLHEYTPLVLADGRTLYIGQDHVQGCHTYLDGVRRELVPGDTHCIRARARADGQLSIAVSRFDRQSVHFFFLWVSDLSELPVVS